MLFGVSVLDYFTGLRMAQTMKVLFYFFTFQLLESKDLLENLKTEISQFQKDIPLSVLSDLLTSVDQAHNTLLGVSPEVQLAEHIRYNIRMCRRDVCDHVQKIRVSVGLCVCVCLPRWIIFLIVSCVVLLVVLCNLLGLLLGPLGLHPNTEPTNRSCTADCGGTFFMM